MFEIVKRLAGQLKGSSDRTFLEEMTAAMRADIGLSTTDVSWLSSAAGDTRARMEAMAGAHGLSADELTAERWREMDMARACGHCGDRRMCRSWLDGDRTGAGPDSFCPNASHFAEMVARKN